VIAQRTAEVCYHLFVPLTTQTLRFTQRLLYLDYNAPMFVRSLALRLDKQTEIIQPYGAPFIGIWYSWSSRETWVRGRTASGWMFTILYTYFAKLASFFFVTVHTISSRNNASIFNFSSMFDGKVNLSWWNREDKMYNCHLPVIF